MTQRSRPGAAALRGLLAGLTLVWATVAQAQTIDKAAVGADTGVGARAMGMGAAFTAVSDDATALSWNPAGATALDRPALSVGYDPLTRIQWSHPNRDVVLSTVATWKYGASTETAKGRLFSHVTMAAPFRLGAVRLVGLAGYRRALDLGLDRDLAYDYEEAGAAALPGPASHYEYASSEGGGLDVLSAGVGVRLASAFSFGVAVERWTGDPRTKWQDRDDALTSLAATEGAAEQKYRGVGLRLGALLVPTRGVRLALVGRLPFRLDADTTLSQTLTREIMVTQSDVRRTGRIDWPATFGVGLALRPRERLLIAADAIVGQWSQAVYDHTYDYTATTTYPGLSRPPQTFHGAGHSRLRWPTLVDSAGGAQNQRQADTLQVRLGVEYVLRLSKAVSLPLRAGGLLDQQLERDAQAKAVRGLGATAGLGVATPHATLDAAWVYGTDRRGVDGSTDKIKRTAQRVYLSLSLRP